nr:hypothetical protein GCM10010200_048740 [Actinomadura rugatobispora]
MGIVDQRELKSAVMVMVRIVEDLIAAIEKADRVKFWAEDRIPLVDQFLDESLSDLRRTVAAKVAAAKRQIALLTRDLPADAARIVLASLSGREARTLIDRELPHQCPVCSQMGWLVCSVERSDVETDYDESGMFYIVHQTAYPHVFECPVCNLTLEDRELDEFEFPREITLEPDTEPYKAFRESDEDLYRHP